MKSDDAFSLERFVAAQEQVFDRACEELRGGRKRSHWMWFVFPQLRGLGFSVNAQFYGIESLDEARAYLAHPMLGPRLVAVTEVVLRHKERSLHAIFGSPDDVKFRSSMTLFAEAAGPDSVFARALDLFCAGEADARTLALLRED